MNEQTKPFSTYATDMKRHVSKKIFNLTILFLSTSFAFLAYTINPAEQYDLYRHYAHIENLIGLPFSQVVENARSGYLLFDSYAWFINYIGFNKKFFTASVVFIAYILVFLVLKDILYKNKTIKVTASTLALGVLLFWQSISFVMLSSGIRGVFSSIILFYSAYYLFEYKRVFRFLVLSLIAFGVHPFAIAYSALIFCSFWFKKYSSLSRLIVILAVLLLFSQGLISYLLSFADELMSGFGFYKSSYLQFDTKWGAGFIATRNMNGIIGTYIITNLPVYVIFFYFLISKPVKNNSLHLLLSLIIAYLFFFFMFYTMFERMHYLLCLLSAWMFFKQYLGVRDNKNKVFLMLYMLGLIMYSVYQVYVSNQLLINL